MIFSLMITTILLTSVPLTIKMIGQYKQIALENSSIEYEFFIVTFKRTKEGAIKPIIKERHTLHLINKRRI